MLSAGGTFGPDATVPVDLFFNASVELACEAARWLQEVHGGPPLEEAPGILGTLWRARDLTTPRPAGAALAGVPGSLHQSWSEQGNWWIDQDAASIALDLPAKEAQLRALVAAAFPPVWRRLEAGQARVRPPAHDSGRLPVWRRHPPRRFPGR